MRYGVVDIGSNSTRLLVAEVEQGRVRVIKTGLTTTRLGEGIGRQNRLLSQAVARTVRALQEYKELITGLQVQKVIVAATSAVRDAANRNEFLGAVKEALGWEVRVLSGEEEAQMSYAGAVRGLSGVGDIVNPVVVDIGGGSTEFVWGRQGGLRQMSLRVGAVRMTEGGQSMEEIKELIGPTAADIRQSGFGNLLGVGGTMTTLAAVEQQLAVYDPDRVHGYRLARLKMGGILHSLEKMSLADRRNVPGLQPQRADIIVAGVRIALAVCESLEAEGITVSETDIMYGLLYEMSERG